MERPIQHVRQRDRRQVRQAVRQYRPGDRANRRCRRPPRSWCSLRASQINGCGLCVDMHTKEAAAAGETAVRLNLVAAWRESTVFTEAERAALALAEEGTRLADAHHGVSDETWAQVRKHYDDDQIAALVCLVALINAANRLA